MYNWFKYREFIKELMNNQNKTNIPILQDVYKYNDYMWFKTRIYI